MANRATAYRIGLESGRSNSVARSRAPLARRLTASVSSWLAYLMFYFSVLVGFVILPVSLIVMLGRMLVG